MTKILQNTTNEVFNIIGGGSVNFCCFAVTLISILHENLSELCSSCVLRKKAQWSLMFIVRGSFFKQFFNKISIYGKISFTCCNILYNIVCNNIYGEKLRNRLSQKKRKQFFILYTWLAIDILYWSTAHGEGGTGAGIIISFKLIRSWEKSLNKAWYIGFLHAYFWYT